MKRVHIFGSNGQLGRCLLDTMPEGFKIAGETYPVCFTHMDVVEKILEESRPDIVINAAAVNGVDNAEDSIAYTYLVNGMAPVQIYELCKNAKITFVHISSDFVFNGIHPKQLFGVSCAQDPVNIYGFSKHISDWTFVYLSKRRGLKDFIMFRTSWLFSEFGDNFLTKMLMKLSLESEKVYGATDVYGSPTYARDLAVNIWKMLETNNRGLFNVTNSSYTPSFNIVSKYDFICEIAKAFGVDKKIHKKSVLDMDLKAPRSLCTALYCDDSIKNGIKMRDWKEALKDAIKRFKQAGP